jgi:hypothetical protein
MGRRLMSIDEIAKWFRTGYRRVRQQVKRAGWPRPGGMLAMSGI